MLTGSQINQISHVSFSKKKKLYFTISVVCKILSMDYETILLLIQLSIYRCRQKRPAVARFPHLFDINYLKSAIALFELYSKGVSERYHSLIFQILQLIIPGSGIWKVLWLPAQYFYAFAYKLRYNGNLNDRRPGTETVRHCEKKYTKRPDVEK